MLVDHERAWLALKALIAEKGSHGQRDLLAAMARLEVQHKLEEGLPERALRLYGVVLSDDLLRPAPDGPRVDRRDGLDDSPAAGRDRTVHQEDTHARDRGTAADDPRAVAAAGSAPAPA